jgi:hypothetical protein
MTPRGDDAPQGASRPATLAAWVAAAVALGAVAIAVRWGAFVAGGSDSYCYLGQARMWLDGSLFQPVRPGFMPPWPNATLSFAPAGFIPSHTVPGGIAPICPPGLAVLMAGADLAGGPRGALAVVPLCAGLIAWCAFLIGRRVAGPWAGVLSALLATLSPAVLYQAVQPMSDVPAAAGWLAALAVLAGGRAPFPGGLAAAVAILVRPNLAPLAVPLAALAASAMPEGATPRRRAIATGSFAAGVLPGVIAVAALNRALYGSFLRSGYGDPSQLFSVAHVVPNLERYFRWLTETHTPWVLLALLAPFVMERSERTGGPGASPRTLAAVSLAMIATILLVYLPYVVFEDWWYLRFLLVGVVLVVVLASAVTVRGLMRVARPAAVPAVILVAALFGTMFVRTARERHVFELRIFEARFVEAATWVRDYLPPEAVVLTLWHSGSVRYYGGRFTVVWDALPPDGLDAAVDYLTGIGRPPFLLFDGAESARFRERFGGTATLGPLDWPPRARIGHDVEVYDPADRARYRRGEPVTTERVWTAAERKQKRAHAR